MPKFATESLPPYPAPKLVYQGGGFVLQPVDLTLGTSSVGRLQTQTVGINFLSEIRNGVLEYDLRPAHAIQPQEDPCNFQFSFYYEQDGIEWNMGFSLASDKGGGVLGTAASLETDSNYPCIPMALPKFTFNQPGIRIEKRYVLPKDYTADLTVKFWLQRGDPAVDGWIRLETFYVKEPEDVGAGPPVLVSTGQATLYPSLGGPADRVLGNAYR
jgi:hypothetical protein